MKSMNVVEYFKAPMLQIAPYSVWYVISKVVFKDVHCSGNSEFRRKALWGHASCDVPHQKISSLMRNYQACKSNSFVSEWQGTCSPFNSKSGK